jgi:hypothetical protein
MVTLKGSQGPRHMGILDKNIPRTGHSLSQGLAWAGGAGAE